MGKEIAKGNLRGREGVCHRILAEVRLLQNYS